MDFTVYYTYELRRIADSAGASEELREQIAVELNARQLDPLREPGYAAKIEEKPVQKPVRRYQRRITI
jgi:hypothetical protein